MSVTVFRRWAWQSRLLRSLYQGAPIVALHKLLSMLGIKGILGWELTDLAGVHRATDSKRIPVGVQQRVLFVTPRNFRTHATFQVGVAQALVARGARCALATCGGIMPVCEVTWAEREYFPRCARCSTYVTELAEQAGIPLYRLSDHVVPGADRNIARDLAHLDVEGLVDYEWNSLPLGRFAIPPTRWRLRSHQFSMHPEGREVLASFIRGGTMWATCFEQVVKTFDPHVVVMLNGLFMEERISWAVASKLGRRCVFFERGRDAGTVFLSHGQSAPRYNVSENWDQVSQVPLPEEERARIVTAIDRRARGIQLVETYWAVKESDEVNIRSSLQLSHEMPLAVLFTNVVWDTAMQDRDTIFADMLDWLRHTLRFFRERREWGLVIRIHPAETQVPGRESYDRVGDWLQDEFRDLPGNVRVVPPDVPIDSYTLARMAKVGCVYASTMGLEMAVAGVPVVVAGAAHYAKKGFTYDPTDIANYHSLLNDLMNDRRRLPRSAQIDLALRYAHVFFLRRMYPMTVLEERHEMRPRLTYRSFDDLLPGKRPVLDVICDGILEGSSFEFHPQTATAADRHDDGDSVFASG